MSPFPSHAIPITSASDYELSYALKARMRNLSSRVLHPDILVSILAFLPRTHLPPLMRTSRYLYTLVGPILYSDLPIPPLIPSAICPHLSPIGSLFLSPGARLPLSPSDLRAVLHDRPSRKRLLLESARTLRIQSQHAHHALPAIMRDLRLDMRKVHTLHLVGGAAICEQPTSFHTCSIYTNLRPKTVVLESSHLALRRIGGLSVEAHEGIEHLAVRLRPSNFGMYPNFPPGPLLPSIRRLTIIFSPDTHLDHKGRTVIEAWSTRSPCGSYYWENKPGFAELLEHIAEASHGIDHVKVVGAELLDEEWISAVATQRGGRQGEPRDARWLETQLRDAEMMQDDGIDEGRSLRAMGMYEWANSVDGSLLDPAPISAGIVGKGACARKH